MGQIRHKTQSSPYIYIYIYICLCVCVCVCFIGYFRPPEWVKYYELEEIHVRHKGQGYIGLIMSLSKHFALSIIVTAFRVFCCDKSG